MSEAIEQIEKRLKKEETQRLTVIMRQVVSHVSRDPILQLGHYITEDDKNKIRQSVFNYEIKAPI